MEVIIIFEVNQSWGYLLSKIGQEMGESFAQKLLDYEITARDFGILSTIYNNEHVTQKDIGLLLTFIRNGFNVKELLGGIAAWNILKLPVEAL